jgi:ABC-type nitrate/sulfonate/bicarbonate transport system ATPase subunit
VDGRLRTVVFVTHDVDEALTLADRILVMRAGRIIDDLAVETARPRTADSLLDPQMVRHKHTLLTHLGLERRAVAQPVEQMA